MHARKEVLKHCCIECKNGSAWICGKGVINCCVIRRVPNLEKKRKFHARVVVNAMIFFINLQSRRKEWCLSCKTISLRKGFDIWREIFADPWNFRCERLQERLAFCRTPPYTAVNAPLLPGFVRKGSEQLPTSPNRPISCFIMSNNRFFFTIRRWRGEEMVLAMKLKQIASRR